ncbi:flagellar hook-associated protein FlgK [Allosphingosinicella indica]|uniref:Flagellar hook-associated protein 1 n=1 Tax=Allosphingosinicella indica TaxID=941907 RepID=A0A1X7GNS3_9SPHN|nr:flagellar hook-associated protein FlgK [Allosphingosinicella indica]SMF72435.1 flagellar hook-associated protein 1 FlgK [Allosphingosinicella indica]
MSSDLLNIGKSGVSAYRTALSIIAENVANSETKGYARREVVLREAGVRGGANNPIYTEIFRFNGVEANSVNRAWDMFRAADARAANSSEGRANARATWLTEIETSLGDGQSSVGSLIGAFYNTAVSLSSTPKELVGRQAMLNALNEAAGTIRNTAASLERVSQGISAAAELEANGLNADLAALAEVNVALRQAAPGRSSFASLEDERDRLIDSISKRIDVDVSIGDKGTATLTIAGSAGLTLLDPASKVQVSVAQASDGRLSLRMLANGATSILPARSGTLAGLVDMSGTTADRRQALEALTTDFATALNAWSAAGTDLDGNAGAPMLDASGGARNLAVAITDPRAVAAQSADGTENGNLLALDALRGTGGAEARWASIVSGNAQMLASARSEAAAAATRRDNALAAHDEIIGVDLDREAADLLRYQQAYGASARIIQIARETMQTIIDLF